MAAKPTSPSGCCLVPAVFLIAISTCIGPLILILIGTVVEIKSSEMVKETVSKIETE